MSDRKSIYLLIVIAILFAFGLGINFFYFFDQINILNEKIKSLESKSGEAETILEDKSEKTTVGCGTDCINAINKAVSQAVATISSSPKEKIIEKEIVSDTPKTSYISMGTTYTTTSTGWYTLEDTAIYIDLINDYGSSAKVSWETLLKVAHANGQAYARLWDDTNKIAVNGSELTTINNASYLQVSSGNLPFWRGRNLYKIQIKSLNSFEITITGAKIKVSN
jgi:hypothetical protein